MSLKTQVQIISIVLILWLVLVGLGLYQENPFALKFPFTKFMIFCGVILFLAISIRGGKRFWTPIFALILVIFNPFYSIFDFSLSTLKISYFAIAFIFVLFVWGYYSTYRKGAMFEKYVSKMFPDGIWTIVDRTKDYSKKLGRKVESDQNPDLTFRHNTAGNKIAVECKYRSNFYMGGVEVLKRQIEKYKEYSQKENVPVYVFIGIGNSPQNPNKLFALPLQKAESLIKGDSEIILKEALKQFEIDTKKEFIKNEIF